MTIATPASGFRLSKDAQWSLALLLSPILGPLTFLGIAYALFCVFSFGMPIWRPLIALRDGTMPLWAVLVLYGAVAASFFAIRWLDRLEDGVMNATWALAMLFWGAVGLGFRLIVGEDSSLVFKHLVEGLFA